MAAMLVSLPKPGNRCLKERTIVGQPLPHSIDVRGANQPHWRAPGKVCPSQWIIFCGFSQLDWPSTTCPSFYVEQSAAWTHGGFFHFRGVSDCRSVYQPFG